MRERLIRTSPRFVGLVVLLVGGVLCVQVAVVSAAPETVAMPAVVAQVPTPTPFRFLTPTPIVPGVTTSTGTSSSTTTTTTTTTPPRAGGFPMELALPALVGGLAAIGGGSALLRRKPAR